MGRRDEPCSSRRSLRPRNNVQYIKEEIISDEDEYVEQYTPPVITRSGRRLKAAPPVSPPSTSSPSSTPRSSIHSYEKIEKVEKTRPPKRKCAQTRTFKSPKAKRMKKDIKLEEPDEEPGHGVSDDSFLIVPENMKIESMKKLHPLDYRDRITAVFRMYKTITMKDEQSNGPVFLHRNLLFIKGHQYKPVPQFVLGEDEPPLVWPFPAVSKNPKRENTAAEKRVRLMDIINVLPNMKKLQRAIASNHGIRDFRFSAGTIAMAGSNGKVALTNDVKYRNYLRKRGRVVPQRVPFNYPVVKEHNIKPPNILMTPSVSRDSSLARPQSNVFYYSIVFKSLRHKLLAGERIAGVTVLLVEQINNHFTRPKRVQSAMFNMNVNSPATTIFIDLPKREPKKGLTVHVLLKVELSTNQNECSVEGHSLRQNASRLSVKSPDEERRTSPRKSVGSAEKPKPVSWEQTLFGTAVIYKDPSLRGPEGYIQGDVSVLLVEKEDIGLSMQGHNFIPTLQDLSKKMHSNPFMQISIGKFNLDDMDSEADRCVVKKEEPVVKQEPVDPAPETTEAEKDEDLDPLRTALDVYTGRFKWDPQGSYVNDRETLKYLFREDIFKDKRNIAAIRKWIPMTIPKKMVYRILCKAEKRAGVEELPYSESYPCELPLSVDYDMKCINLHQSAKGNECIICNRKFDNMFALMLHYHTSYPRLSFKFQLGDRSITKDNTSDEVRIDVMLDPSYMEAFEVCFFKEATRRKTTSPFYLTTKCQSRALRSLMRMDLTIFLRFIKLPEIIDDTTVMKSRFVDTNCGRQLRLAETYGISPKSVPQPSFDNLVQMMTETIMDYIDIDDQSKRYMCTWNKMTLAIGRGNLNKAGVYMLHRLFLELFGEHIKERQQTERFVFQVIDQVEKGALSGDDQYDLFMRLQDRDYKPLRDTNSSLFAEILLHAKQKHKNFNQAVAKAKHPKAAGIIRRTFLRCYRNDPNKLSEKGKLDLVRKLFYTPGVIHKADSRRQYIVSPFKFIFNGHYHSFFDEMPP